jgi:hypothetical protein
MRASKGCVTNYLIGRFLDGYFQSYHEVSALGLVVNVNQLGLLDYWWLAQTFFHSKHRINHAL